MEDNEGVEYSFFEKEPDPAEAFSRHKSFLSQGAPTGIELDTDSIAGFPASARTPHGISMEQAIGYLRVTGKTLIPAYLHIAEAAPSGSEEIRYFGKALAYLVSEFLKTLLAKVR